MRYVEKACLVCGNKFVVNERVADRELFCTLGCCSQAMADQLESNVLEA